MTPRLRSLRTVAGLLFAAALTFSTLRPAHAAWMDLRYQYRVPLTLSNSSSHAFASGDIVAATLPQSALSGHYRADGADLALAYNDASIPGKALVMGGSVKVLFALPADLPPAGTLSGLALYFGGPSVTAPTAAPAGVQVFDFSDGQTHGWKSLQDPSGNGDLHIATDGTVQTLALDTSLYHHPMAFASAMNPVGEATTYAKLRTNGGENEASTLQRFTTQTLSDTTGASYLTGGDTPAAGLAVDSWGSQEMDMTAPLGNPEGTNGRQHPGPNPLNPGTAYVADAGKYQFLIAATQDGAGNATVLGKAWQAAPPYSDGNGDPVPGGFQLTRATGLALTDGVAALMLYSTSVNLHWMVVVPNGYAEMARTTAGAAEEAPAPDATQAVVQGEVYDQLRGTGFTVPNAAVTITDGVGTTLSSGITDTTGHYRLLVPAGTDAASITVQATTSTVSGSVAASITGGNTYTEDIGVTYPGRLTGTVVDRDGSPVAGAAVGGFLDDGPFVTTDDTGHFSLPVPAGTAVVGAHKEGYLLSGPRWIKTTTGTTSADFTLFTAGEDTLLGKTPAITGPGSVNSTGTASLTDGDLQSAWTSGATTGLSPSNPLRITFALASLSVGQVEVHWKSFPSAWHIEMGDDITYSNGASPHLDTRSYYSAGESTPAETGGYATSDRHVTVLKTAAVTGVKTISIVVTGVFDANPLVLDEIIVRGPQRVSMQDAASALSIAAGFRTPPTDPNAFEWWNADNEPESGVQKISMRDVLDLAKDTNREVKRLRVLVVNYEPYLNQYKMTLQRYFGWNSPYTNTEEHRKDMESSSHNYLRVYIQPQISVDEYPVFTNGFRFDDTSYVNAAKSGTWPSGSCDYNAIIKEFDIARRVDCGDIDEVWVQAVPGFQMWETTMAGPNAYWCNSGAVPGPPDSINGTNGTRLFVITAFNYEREPDVMIHDWGHRAESIVGNKVYGGYWYGKTTVNSTWDRYARYDKAFPGQASGGNCHYPPNGTSDYDYGNTTYVSSDADDWLNYPNLTGARKQVSNNNWKGPHRTGYETGGPDYQRNFLIWWFYRMPHIPGYGPDGKLANWWKYIADPNAYPESR